MSDDKKVEIPMAECGSCRAIVPLDSKQCSECGVSFSGVSDEALGECAACNALVPIDSKQCSECGVYFVADDVVDVLRQWLLNTGIEVEALFSKIDVDGNGQIDSEELKESLLKLNLADLPPSQVDRLISQFDSDSDGLISYDELVYVITGEEAEEKVEDSEDAPKPKEFSENVLTRVMDKYSITDRDSFLAHAQNFDENENGYLTEGELKKAAEQFSIEESTESNEDETDQEIQSEAKSEVDEELEEESAEDEESVEESEVEEESAEEEKLQEEDIANTSSDDSKDSPLYKFALVAAEKDMTIREIFESMDKDDDGMIDGPELQNGIKEISGDSLSPSEIFELLKSLDEDSNGRIDPMELVRAIENMDIEIKSDKISEPRDPIQTLIDAMDESGSNPASIFRQLDKDNDGNIQEDELRNRLQDVIGDTLSEEEMNQAFSRLDKDKDGSIDLFEFIEKLEEYDDGSEDVARLSTKTEFPSSMQKRMMSKNWNDVVWPLLHTGLFIFVVLWLVNATLAPFVDGSGGNIELDSELGLYNDGDTTYFQGDVYPCEDSIQIDGCKNSFTPLAGEAGSTSMPAGFYWDGILFIVLGTLGFIGSLFTHLSIVPGWRARARAIKESEEERKEVEEEITGSEEDEGDEVEAKESENADDSEEVLDDVQDEEDEYEDDEIDIGSHIGLVLDDEEVFGVIIEFDDDENLVTIEEDGTGDLVTGYQDDMFIED